MENHSIMVNEPEVHADCIAVSCSVSKMLLLYVGVTAAVAELVNRGVQKIVLVEKICVAS